MSDYALILAGGKRDIMNWTILGIPSQTNKLAVVTGATGGLGYETALGLAQAGAEVILAGRNHEKGRDAIRRIRQQAPSSKIRFEKVDLAVRRVDRCPLAESS
jgi:NAD(P)-dependent dehydrogenase (short-subunit alcohol dehydrogenase family)